jgi:hypothetical protein
MRIIIKIIIKIIKNKYKIRIFINLDIETNYIKKKLALDISILLILKVISLILLEKKRIYLYKNYVFRITTKDILKN